MWLAVCAAGDVTVIVTVLIVIVAAAIAIAIDIHTDKMCNMHVGFIVGPIVVKLLYGRQMRDLMTAKRIGWLDTTKVSEIKRN